MSKPFVAQWGILGTGWMSSMFTKDLVFPPSSRNGESSVTHAIAAVGSRSLAKAEEFIVDNCPQGAAGQVEGHVSFKPRAYGSYKEVIADENVNIVYVGTMNTCHFDDAKLTLDAGKHCLLEKPATLNAAEWRFLSALAKEKKVFLMEAVWTRFNPVLLEVQQKLHAGEIGDIRCLYSDLSMRSLDTKDDSHRVLSAELAGGPLLDLGPYPLVWALMMLFHHPQNERTPPEKVGSTMLLHKTGVDLATSFSLTFPKINAMAFLTVNLFSATDEERHTRIVGSKGEIIVRGATARPTGYTVKRFANPTEERLHSEGDTNDMLPEEHFDRKFDGVGWNWEADEVARCLKDGLLESPKMPHEETEMTMELFDRIRKDGGYKYLPGLERVQLEA